MISVLIADDQPVIRQGFAYLLRGHPDITVLGQAASGQEAVRKCRHLDPDVVLMDIRMPGGDGIRATQALLAESSPVHPEVVVITTFHRNDYLFSALDAGASGFLLKDLEPEDLAQAVLDVAQGRTVIDPRLVGELVGEFSRRRSGPREPSSHVDQLTRREREVAAHLSRGLTNVEIADALHIEASTVKTHIAHITSKLGLRSRVQIVVWAYENGLVCAPPTH